MRSFTLLYALHLFLGAAFLPFGDLASLDHLPEWYAHCKEEEDADMTPLDFITDHLVNVDHLFDAHGSGDHQRPHQPFHLSVSPHLLFGTLQTMNTLFLPAARTLQRHRGAPGYEYRVTVSIFHPPCA